MQSIRFTCALGFLGAALYAQVDPSLAREVTSIRLQVARNNASLQGYTWTEHTEVRVDGKLQSSTDLTCRYDASGQIVKTPVAPAEEKSSANGQSNRPLVRKKADTQDYIERAVRMIANYVPPKPEQLDALMQRGLASAGQSFGKYEIRFKEYYQEGDSMTFTYDPISKNLLNLTVLSTLGSPKDPVRMDAVFETLPDAVNHLASTTVSAKTKKIEVKMQNLAYTKTN